MTFLKHHLDRHSPSAYIALERAWRASPIGRQRSAAALRSQATTVARRNQREVELYYTHVGRPITVLGGPFGGMFYSPRASSIIGPKFVGSYESEITAWMEIAIEQKYDVVINIGCGEGYYAVGFARHLLQGKVFGFDIDVEALEMCRENVALNAVENRIELKATCSHEELRCLLRGRCMVICDIEGGERALLDPVAVPSLDHADLVVETHDFRSPGITAELVERFRKSHRIEIVSVRTRMPQDFPALERFPPGVRAQLIDEWRNGDQCWMQLTADTLNLSATAPRI